MQKKLIYLLLTLSLLFTGCDVQTLSQNTNTGSVSSEQATTSNTANNNSAATKDVERNSTSSKNSYSLSNIPEYSGTPYVEINNNKPFFSSKDKKRTDAFENYSELDALGRCGVAYANVCKKLQPTEKRGSIGMVKPSGWHTVKYKGHVDGNYLYNRCHLIGYQLTGENANRKNLITGTRYMNCDGQLPFENQVDAYVDATGNHVLYRVTPIFEGDNLVASGVLTEAYSVEDNGKGCQFCVYCYNVQPGIDINYTTGESCLSSSSQRHHNQTSNNNVSDGHNGDTHHNTEKYILNKNTHKFHTPDCSLVNQIHHGNRKDVTCDRNSLIQDNYEPCKKCNP